MKKAKRLLAVLLAVVMLLSAASINTYAYTSANNYHEPKVSNEMYWFNYEQGCGYLLDLLDDMLADAGIYIGTSELDVFLNDALGMEINIVTEGVWWFLAGVSLDLDQYLKDAGVSSGDLDLRSVDGLVKSLYGLLNCLDSDNVPEILENISGIYDVLGELNTYLNVANLDNNCTRATAEDSEVLEMLILWLYNHSTLLVKAIAGTLDWGDLLGDMIGDLLGGDTANLDLFVKNMLYTMLVDDSLEAIPEGETIDTGLQKVIDWALITGTGASPETGSNSILGANAEGLMPGMANQPGGATITGIAIQADRDLDGVAENVTMSTYQLVANLLECLMGGMLGPMLSELLYDAFDVEITEQYPYGDPEVMNDQTFSMVIGLVESLLVQNGAPTPEYSEEENTYPALKIDAMLDWLFNGGGLDAFILIDYQGIHIQDNFMSLLNDLIRLLVNMLPSLGLFASSAHLSYSSDEMNAVWYYNDAGQLVAEGTEGAIDVTYVTYETKEVVYATEYQTVNEVTTPVAYNYLATDMPVNIADDTASDYANPKFIRNNYVIATDQVYATVIKMALNDMIEGCYFPEWATDIPTVLAYGLAALAAPAVPENNFYARLDAYHELTLNGGVGVVVDVNGNNIEPIPYTTVKVIPEKDAAGNLTGKNHQVVVPSGALSIGCSYLAAYLNTILKLDGKNLSTDTTLEQFAGEFLLWGFTEYVPMLSGEDTDGNGTMDTVGTWRDAVNTYVAAVYQADENGSYGSRTYKETANFDAIYDLLDATLFSLIPTSWLPNITSSTQLINEWLLGNLIEFDLQGILGLLSVNMDPSAELNKPLLEVLLLVIDRVLAIVFNDSGLLLPDGRTNVVKNKNYTTIKTLDALLSSKDASGNPSEAASLPVFLKNLLSHLNTYKSMIFGTVLPLLVSDVYERPYDTDYLGTNMTRYKIQDLEDYIDSFGGNINATEIRTFDNAEDAEAAAAGDATVQRVVTTDDAGNITATTYQVKLNNGTTYGSYATKEEADAVIETLEDSYVYEYTSEDGVTTYTVYSNWSYLDTALSTSVSNDHKDSDYTHVGGNYTTYSEFQFANLTTTRSATTPFVSYETGYHRFFAYEDWGDTGYYYAAVNNALEDGSEFVSEYNSFAESTLPAAYGEWFMYSINAQLKAKDLYDSNDDGYSVLSETDSNYVAPTTDADGNVTDDGNPVDGDPGIPSAIYPFSTTDATDFPFEDSVTGDSTSVKMNEMTAANYEQLAMAIAYGENEENDVRFNTDEMEAIIRLALNTVAFDITPYATAEDGTLLYNAGSKQWNTLTEAEFTTIVNWCTANGLTCGVETLEDGTTNYWIARPAFKLLDAGLALGGVAAKPLTNAEYDAVYGKISMLNDTNAQGAAMTYADDVKMQIHKSYEEYVNELYTNRRGIYNMIDLISYRYERAESNRLKTADTTMLKWIKDLSASAYKNTSTQLRNYKYTGDVDVATGELAMTKVYTSGSYADFKEAYDYAESLINAVEKQTMAENEFTQSLITEAYLGLLKAYLNLVDYKGAASWEQLDYYMEIANGILTDDDRLDAVLGYQEAGLKVLESTYAEADTLRNDSDVDDERQTEVDNMAAALRQAINALVYNTAPSLTAADLGDIVNNTAIHVTSEDGAARIVGQVYGLEEGVGAVMDIVELIGMRLDEGVGNTLTITGSGKGAGTGAYYRGTVGNNERFRYYAVLYGDINGDSRIDGTDATALELYTALNSVNSMDSIKSEAADADHDGSVDEFDVAAIVDHYTFVEKIDQTAHSTSTVAA